MIGARRKCRPGANLENPGLIGARLPKTETYVRSPYSYDNAAALGGVDGASWDTHTSTPCTDLWAEYGGVCVPCHARVSPAAGAVKRTS